MQLRVLLSLSLAFMILGQVQAQRFLEEVFTDAEIEKQDSVIYAINETVLAFPQLGQAIPDALEFDFYAPANDNIDRPLVIFLHTGNFLPIATNGSQSGTIDDLPTVEMARRLAKLGYAVAVCTYRLGWNPFGETQPDRAESLINAAYRGMQDARTAVRFFKQSVIDGNSYQVDTSRITMFGQGTGGYVSLAAATLDEYNDILTTTNGPGKFVRQDPDFPGGIRPMIIEQVNGDINGTSYGILPDSLGMPADTLCRPNYVGLSSDFQLCVNVGGALGDISWLDNDDMPIISFQTWRDPFAPYEDADLIVPTTGETVARVQGARIASQQANDLGLNQPFIDANLTDPITDAAKSAAARTGHDYYEGLYTFTLPTNSFGREEGSPWDWWNEAIWSKVPHPSCPMGSTVDQCNFHTIGLLGNELMSEERGKIYIDTIMGYFAPRAYEALDLDQIVNVNEVSNAEVGLSLAPNPASEVIMLSTSKVPMNRVEVFTATGQLVKSYQNIEAYQQEISGLSPGLYIARVFVDKGFTSQRFVFE